MTINLDVVIDTPAYEVDMKAGLESLQGVSEATRCISETVLNGRVPERQSSRSSVRTTLKQTFSGSYGHIFSIDLFDEELNKKYRRLGKSTFVELIEYFITEALYNEPRNLSEKAQKFVYLNADLCEKLINQLRRSSLKQIHATSIKFGYALKLRFRKNRDDQSVIAVFNDQTAKVLEARPSDEKIELTVRITRLNTNTGNGRFIVKGENETVAFGFSRGYKLVRKANKKSLSSNLDRNNGVEDEDSFEFMKISASPIKLKDGKIIKYIVQGLYDD